MRLLRSKAFLKRACLKRQQNSFNVLDAKLICFYRKFNHEFNRILFRIFLFLSIKIAVICISLFIKIKHKLEAVPLQHEALLVAYIWALSLSNYFRKPEQGHDTKEKMFFFLQIRHALCRNGIKPLTVEP